MSKIIKMLDYIKGAFFHPDLFFYYIGKVYKYRSLPYADELLYWKHKIPKYPQNWSQEMQLKDMYYAVKYIEDKFKITGKDIKCMDLGSGPRSRLTAGYDAGKFDLLAIDPLAYEYVTEFGGRDFLRVGNGEYLEDYFDKNTQHIVYICNALDHSKSPQKTIESITNVLKDNGLLIVCGNINNGDLSKWLGPHQHNLWIENNELRWQNKEMKEKGKFINITDKHLYTCIKQYNSWFTEDGNNIPWFLGIWSKN